MLNSYEDIFSDFDPRPYKVRALSDDFLNESKKASIDKSLKGIELKFLVPGTKRSLNQEAIIKKRLRAHFKRHYNIIHSEINSIIKQGLLFTVIGIVLMFLGVSVLYMEDTLLTKFLFILFEPGGWFFFWEGLGLIIFNPKTKRSDLDYYRKMANCRISFLSY